MQNYVFGAVTISLSVWLLGCASLDAVESSRLEAQSFTTPSATMTAQQVPNTGQMLDISAQVIISNQVIQLEVAQTPDQMATGLMFRTELAADRGMLFKFDSPRFARFWMKNVSIPLDMVFLKDGEVVAIAADVPPCNTATCPTYGPDAMVDQVLELRGGRAAELGLQEGDRLTIEYLEQSSDL